MSKSYNVDKIYKKALDLLDKNQEIVFESILYDILGVSYTWFYDVLFSDDERKDEIKERIFRNRGAEALKSLQDMKASDAPACIISRAKYTNEDIRNALNDREPQENKPNIIVNIGGEQDVEVIEENSEE